MNVSSVMGKPASLHHLGGPTCVRVSLVPAIFNHSFLCDFVDQGCLQLIFESTILSAFPVEWLSGDRIADNL